MLVFCYITILTVYQLPSLLFNYSHTEHSWQLSYCSFRTVCQTQEPGLWTVTGPSLSSEPTIQGVVEKVADTE